jgi:hypothetical protein
VKNRTPFLPAISHLVNGRRPRCERDRMREHENRLFQRLYDFFAPGDIVVADRGFCGHGQFATLITRQVEMLERVHQRRKVDWRKGKSPGPV